MEKLLKDSDGDTVKCGCSVCDKELDASMELEYSEEYTTFFCSPDCAVTFYMEQARSRTISTDDDLPDEYRFGDY